MGQKLKIGSLCTGYGGLDMAVEAFFNAETVWTSDYDKYASIVIEQRLKKPNLGDIKQIKWDEVEPIDILTAGYPCQPFSVAGNRKGENDPRHIWPYIKKAIGILRPKFVILENVKGHLSLGFDKVLNDLTSIGYDARWHIVRAAEQGAPHHRRRLFVVAYPFHNEWASNWEMQELGRRPSPFSDMHLQDPPSALDQGMLRPEYAEYMMGLPAGWVTDLDLSRSQKFKIIGNGVVPQQAYYALQQLLTSVDN
jgi:DNA (cytosine-5)-methyltransferase 1